MILMASLDLPSRAIREQIASALQLVIQVSRLSDGSRKLTHVSEVAGMEGQVITMQDLFRFEQAGLDSEGKVRGQFRSTGIRPRFAEKFESLGIHVGNGMFSGVA
jgi:pilus assembly protein CpaF